MHAAGKFLETLGYLTGNKVVAQDFGAGSSDCRVFPTVLTRR